MGAWGVHSFQNDSASDWVYDLEDSDGFEFLEKTLLETIAQTDYLEAPEGCYGVAAAETVACLLGHRPSNGLLNSTLKDWLGEQSEPPPPHLVELSLKALDRVESHPSELLELWEEGGNFEEWTASLVDLRRRLTGPA